MKKSSLISIWGAIISTTVVIIALALYQPLSAIMVGKMPMMVYAILLITALVIVSAYILVYKIEKLEEKGE
ncbi:exported hypothetical protein [[Clostridium] ultunense Esp]|nr:exported hypothetical protein [[Clostridium] ultunense Esp]